MKSMGHAEPEAKGNGHTPAADEELGECASRAMPAGWPGIYIRNGKEAIHAFQYVHMGLELFAADGHCFVFEFNVNVGATWRVWVYGINLWPIFLNIHLHKLEWIAKADRDFAEDGKPYITHIVVESVPEGSPPLTRLPEKKTQPAEAALDHA
jgi:hypothetical protein